MNMRVETRLSDQIARYMDLASSEAKLTAANMANIDTPGYQSLGMDFEADDNLVPSEQVDERNVFAFHGPGHFFPPSVAWTAGSPAG